MDEDEDEFFDAEEGDELLFNNNQIQSQLQHQQQHQKEDQYDVQLQQRFQKLNLPKTPEKKQQKGKEKREDKQGDVDVDGEGNEKSVEEINREIQLSAYQKSRAQRKIKEMAQDLAYSWAKIKESLQVENLLSNQEFMLQLFSKLVVPNSMSPDEAFFNIFCQFVLQKITAVMTQKKSQNFALIGLTLIDLWIVTPMDRFSQLNFETDLLFQKKTRTPEKLRRTKSEFEQSQESERRRKSFQKDVKMMEEIEKLYLSPRLVNQRKNVFNSIDIFCKELISFYANEFYFLSEDDTLILVNQFNEYFKVRFSINGKTPLLIDYSGVLEFIEEFTNILHELLSPSLKIAAQFIFRIELPKFFRGFLIQINSNVIAYNKFLQRKEQILSDQNIPNDNIDLYLWSELQRNLELHPSLPLTNNPNEIQKEKIYLVNVIQKLRFYFFPNGVLSSFLESMLPQPLFHLVKEFIGKTEPYVDAFFLEKIAHEVLNYINRISSPDLINETIIDYAKRKYPTIYYSEINQGSTSTSSELAYTLIHRIAESNLFEDKSNWSFKEWIHFPVSWLLGTQDLVIGAVMELFGIIQQQIFVKNVIYQTLDFLIKEMESNAYRFLHLTSILQSSNKEAIDNYFSLWKKIKNGNIFDRNLFESNEIFREFYDQDPIQDQEEFISLLDQMKGGFAAELATNLVSLFTFRHRNSWARSGWSSSTASSLLQTGSSIAGLSDIIGHVLISNVEKTWNGLTQIGYMEDLVLNFLENGIGHLKQKKEDCIFLRQLLHEIFENEENDKIFDEILNSKTKDEGLELVLQHITNWELRVQFGNLIKEAIEKDSCAELSFDVFGIKQNVDILWERVKRRIEAHQYKKYLLENLL